MKTIRRKGLKRSMYILIFTCWILPLLCTILFFSLKQEESLVVRLKENAHSVMNTKINDLTRKFNDAIDESRNASYDNVLSIAYKDYVRNEDWVTLYSKTSNYLSAQYSYNSLFDGSILLYTKEKNYYVYSPKEGTRNYTVKKENILRDYNSEIKDITSTLGTNIEICYINGNLYLVRNLVDSSFEPFATLVLPIDMNYFLPNWSNQISTVTAMTKIDDIALSSYHDHVEFTDKTDSYDNNTMTFSTSKQSTVNGHNIYIEATFSSQELSISSRGFYRTLIAVVILSGGLFATIITYIYKNFTKPMKKLLNATMQIEQGDLGYQIESLPKSTEFYQLTKRFNIFSRRLKNQFERNTKEQQALHDSRIKALQSQINPHFLNNTLEMINWQARINGDEKVSEMISALSIMLNAAMARGGSSIVTMKEEFSYIEAYLYIVSHRFGSRLTVNMDISPDIWDAYVPRLILQPIVENAIEHGIALQSKGELHIFIYRKESDLIVDVEHVGEISANDRETIDRLLNWNGEENTEKGSARIGIRNVQYRLKMLCGKTSGLTIEEYQPGQVRSRIILPFNSKK